MLLLIATVIWVGVILALRNHIILILAAIHDFITFTPVSLSTKDTALPSSLHAPFLGTTLSRTNALRNDVVELAVRVQGPGGMMPAVRASSFVRLHPLSCSFTFERHCLALLSVFLLFLVS